MENKSNPSYLPQYSHEPLPLHRLSNYGIHSVRITLVDLVNNTCFRVLPISSFIRLLASSRPGIVIPECALGIVGITCAAGFGPMRDIIYVVDLASLRLCSYAPGHASIMGWFQDKIPAPGRVLGTGIPMCPRSVLNRIVDTAKSHNTAFLVGFETEFVLLKNTSPIEAVNVHANSISKALATGNKETEVMEEIALSLIRDGIDLIMYHSEAGAGQYEIVTGPLPPLEAADALVHTRETIVNIANKHGLHATFAPRLNMNDCGNGAHTHISVHPIHARHSSSSSSTSATNDDVLTPAERIFLAGLLAHLPAACAFTLPTRASYARMHDGVWSGGTWVAWGRDNREVPVRMCVPPAPALESSLASPESNSNPIQNNNVANNNAPSKNHFEVRCVDGTASPYLVLSALLGAGLSSIQLQTKTEDAPLSLVEQDCASCVPSQMSESERASMGVRHRLPRTWEEARGVLVGDSVLCELIGREAVHAFLAVGEAMDKHLGAPTNEEKRVQILIDNY